MDLSFLPALGLGLFAIAVFLYLLTLALKSYAKPCEGNQMGPQRIVSLIGSGRTHIESKGNTAEVTDLFFTPDLLNAFEQEAFPGLNKKIECLPEGTEKDKAKKAKQDFESFLKSRSCRLYITRRGEITGKKDMFVQHTKLDKRIDEFASYDLKKRSRNTLSGPVTEHFILGSGVPIPGEVHPAGIFKQFGPFRIILFDPIEHEQPALDKETNEKQNDALANLAAVIKLMPSVLYNYHIVKQLKDEIKNLKHVILRYRIRFAAKNAQLNGMIETMENYHPTSGPEPSTFSKNTSVIDFAIQLAFPLICGAIFGYLGGPSFVGVSLALLGVVIGSCVGAVLSHWRRN